jgi:hypothetical protein
VHRAAGKAFVVAMLVMAVGALLIEVVRGASPAINVPAALLTAYLVVTGTTALRPPSARFRRLDRGGTAIALGVAMVTLAFGTQAIALGGERNDIPAFPFFLFGGVALLAAVGDVRVARAGGITGRARLARHLWRMCFALFIASMSFFIGQADKIPAAIRIPALLAAPVVVVPATMFFWLWRVRRRRDRSDVAEAA